MKKGWKIVWWFILSCAVLVIAGAAAIWGIDIYVESTGKQMLVTKDTAPESDAIIVLGAYVQPDGQVSEMLRDRLEMGYALYTAGKAPKIL